MKNKLLLAGALLFTLLLSSCAAVFEDVLPTETKPTDNGTTTEAVGTSTLPVNGTTTLADDSKASVIPTVTQKPEEGTTTTTVPAATDTPAPVPVPALDPTNDTEQTPPQTDTPTTIEEESKQGDLAPAA